MMDKINVAIVGDGATDHKIFGKIIECILLEENPENISCEVIPLVRHKICDHVQKYKRECKKDSDYYLPSQAAVTLRDGVLGTINNAFKEFENTVEISYRDILLITTDTEHTLGNKNQYFESWPINLSHILMESIDKFYNLQSLNGYDRQYLPIVMSLATFPSTEVIVAAARGLLNKHYGKKPQEWKDELYGTRTPRDEDIQNKALDFITPSSINNIFKNLPESRVFIKTLSLGLKYCLSNCHSDD